MSDDEDSHKSGIIEELNKLLEIPQIITSNVKKMSTTRSSGMIGCIAEYTPGSNFKYFHDRLNQYFIANDLSEEKKVPTFLASVSDEIYTTCTSLCSPMLPSQKKFEELMVLLEHHYDKKVNKRAQRFKFFKEKQQEGQTISDYILTLKTLAATCEFGGYIPDTNPQQGTLRSLALEDALTDQFIVGLSNEKIQQRLLSDESKSFDACCETALNMEMSAREQLLIKPVSSSGVNRVTGGTPKRNWNRGKSPSMRNRSQSRNNNKNNEGNSESTKCKRCGRKSPNHTVQECPALQWDCFFCGKKGHTSTVCFARNKSTGNRQNKVLRIHCNYIGYGPASRKVSPPLMWEVKMDHIPVQFEVDDGSGETIISLQEYQDKFQSKYSLNRVGSLSLSTFTDETVSTVGSFIATVEIGGVEFGRLEALVVDTGKRFTALLGRSWLDVINPSWRELLTPRKNVQIAKLSEVQVSQTQSDVSLIEEITRNFPYTVSQDTNQKILGYKAQILLEPCQPIFHKAYTVPYRSREKVEKELERLVNKGILTPVRHSKWASPIVIVPKGDHEVRLCINAKVTINPFLTMDHYPLPTVEDIFVSLANSYFFCVIDLKNAYLQLEVEEESKEFLTINTHLGLFIHNFLAQGVKTGCAIFQSVMDRILKGIKGCAAYLDDIVIGSSTYEGCKEILFQVLEKLNEHHILINLDKCQLLVKSIKYLGHVLEGGQVKPNPDKVRAIMDAPAPKNGDELISFLGLINYYRDFMPSLSEELKPLYNLTKMNVRFKWDMECHEAFQTAKIMMIDSDALTLFDPSKETILSCDASPIGIGVCLSQIVNGEERPISFASASLNDAERGYSQVHREALAIIFGVTKYFKYLYGKIFTIYTDNQAVKEIFNPRKGTSAVAASRLQRWAILLSIFEYKIVHRPGKKMGNVDALSRLPIEENHDVKTIPVNKVSWEEAPIIIDFKIVQEESKKDEAAKSLMSYLAGKPNNTISSEFKRFEKQLSLEDDCIFYGERLFIPRSLRLSILKMLHGNHSGMVLMKQLARSYVWWPGIDRNIEEYVKSCEACQQTGTVKKEKLTSKWPETNGPFQRVHLDFFHFEGKTFLIIVDSYSNYIDIVWMKSTTAENLIKVLQEKFSFVGLFIEIVTDNGPPFNSWEFAKFCRERNIKLSHSPVYHPASNGRAERGVRIVKTVFKKFLLTSKEMTIEEKIHKFLLHYRNSPNSTSTQSPNEMIFAFKPRTEIDNVNPKKKVRFDLSQSQNKSKEKIQEKSQDVKIQEKSQEIEFKENEKAFYKNHVKSNVKWLPCVVKKKLSMLRYLISLDSKIKMVHLNQLKKYHYPFNMKPGFNNSNLQNSWRFSSDTFNDKKRRRERVRKEPFVIDEVPASKFRKTAEGQWARRSERIRLKLERKRLQVQQMKKLMN